MNQNLMDANTKLDRITEPDKFDRIVGAILAGKYSWACVLMLRFAGYNPLHYIPYRTYNRLIKNNPERDNLEELSTNNLDRKANRERLANSSDKTPALSTYQIKDLNYLERLSRSDKQLRGGNSAAFSVDRGLWQDDFDTALELLAIAA